MSIGTTLKDCACGTRKDKKNMSRIKKEDIIAHLIKGEMVCCDCLEKSEETSGQLLTERDVSDDDCLTCDRCNTVIIG